jgi:hypothetical protein
MPHFAYAYARLFLTSHLCRTLFQRKGTRSKLSEEHQAERLKVEQQVQHDALARTRLSEIYDGFYAVLPRSCVPATTSCDHNTIYCQAFYEIKMLVVRDSWHRYRETNLFEKVRYKATRVVETHRAF